MSKTTDDLLPTRWSLVNRLKNLDDQESWTSFFDMYGRLIYAVALKSGLTETEAQEVVQETVISVAKKMPDFDADPAAGSFKGWLLCLTRRRVVDQLRKRPPPGRMKMSFDHPGETARTATIERIPDPDAAVLETLWEQEWQRNLLDAAMERVKQRINPRQYQIFHLLAVKQFPPDKVAASLRISVDNVYLVKHRISALVKKEIELLEKKGK